ncbi:MAG: LptF/LptG family permease [Gemmatimonadales bacterium]|jgi:lipopolysaccharide export system permease protein
MKILRRYILREHAGPFIAALGVLTGLMLLNQLARRFSDLVGKGLPWYVIGEVFALSFPFILAMVVPMAVLVAVLYTFGRLTGDNEVTAFKAGGVSLLRLMLPVFLGTTLLAGGMVWFNDKILPESNHALRKLLSDIGRKRPTFELRERVVNEVVSGKLFLQAARIDRMRSVMWDMVIFDLGRPNVQRTIYADSGYMAFNEEQTDLYLTLFDGSMHELDTRNPGTDQSTYYAKQVIRVPEVSNELERGQSGDWRGDREMSIAMMRDEVADQRERLHQSRDSLEALLASLRPIRALPDTQPEKPPPSAGSPATDRRTQEAEAEKAAAVTDSLAGDSTVTTAAPADSVAREEAETQSRVRAADIRRRYRRPRASEWPPVGDAIAFASQTRSRFERITSRIELQRREINRFEVEIEKKFAIPAAAIVFVLLGAPIAVRFPRGGIGMVIGVSLVAFSVYYIFLIGGEDFADRDFMSPFWAMWAPNVIFTVLGLVLLYLVTLGGTTKASLTRLVPAYGRARLAGAKVVKRKPVGLAEPEVFTTAGPAPHESIGDDREPSTPTAVDPSEPTPSGAIDVNHATIEELERLPGIGRTRAISIVRWRDEHGPFEQVVDLLEVPGIGPAILLRLEGQVRVERNGA